MSAAQQVIENIVQQIVAEIEAGCLPWVKPWQAGHEGLNLGGLGLPLRVTGEPYRGINILALWCAASAKGYRSRHWMTFKQALAFKGAGVRKGEKATGIIYADKSVKIEEGENGEDVARAFTFLKAYSVFNADQIDGLPEHFYVKPPAPAPVLDDQAEQPEEFIIPGQAWLDAVPAVLRHGGDRAYFSPHHDFVAIPEKNAFRNPQAYTSTLIHELVHWTGHQSRLDRLAFKRWGDDAYAHEELTAELGAAFGCANLGLLPQIREDHAPYLKCWLDKLKLADGAKALMQAAARASAAIDYLDAFSQATADENEILERAA